MPYLPKSKYKLSQTSGREFMYAQSQKEYTGPYIILSDGNLFAGNNANKIKASDIIIPLQKSKKDDTYIVMEEDKIGKSVDYFNTLNKNIFKQQDDYKPIMSTKPSPTKEDYIKGYFYRYIVKRRNSDNHYYEVNKETHESIKNEEGKYDDYLHISKKIKWSLSDNSGKNNNLEIRKIVRTTKFKRLKSFFKDLEEYHLSNEILNPKTTPENINAPKMKLPLNSRKTVVEAQQGAIDIIKEKSRKRYNKSSGNGNSSTSSSSGGRGGY
jgi:hypothetical protein